MKDDIKLTFTDEEVDEYISDLQNAVGNKARVYQLLDLNHLPILVAYLRRIGMPEDYLDFAAVVEFTRFKMRDVLSNNNHKSCTVSNRGVESEPKASSLNYMANKSLIGMDKNGTFWLDNERYFDKENWRRNIFIRRKSFSSIERERGINGYGVAYLMFKSSDRYFYMQHRKEIDGVPYFITESSDGLGFEHTRQTVDIGQPVYNGEFENTFAENFRMYTTVFPMLKYWYQVEYNVDENNVDEYSRKIECEHLKDEIIDLNGTIEMLNSMMYRHRLSYDVVGKKIDGLISYLKEMNVTTKEGKDVIDSLLELAEGVREENQVDEPESNLECHVETKEDLVGLDIDELNVILKIKQNKVNGLKSLKGKYETANDNYKRVIGEIERKIEELKIAVVKENKEDNEINEVSL